MKFWRSNNRERVCLTFVIQTLSVGEGIRTTEGINQQIYSLPHLATLVFARLRMQN